MFAGWTERRSRGIFSEGGRKGQEEGEEGEMMEEEGGGERIYG